MKQAIEHHRIAATRKFLSRYLKSQVTIVITLAPKLSDPFSEKYFHPLRVATRRTRAVVWILKHNPKKQGLRASNLYLKKLGNLLGKIRDLNFAIADAKNDCLDDGELKLQHMVLEKKIQKMTGREPLNEFAKQIKIVQDFARRMSSTSVMKTREELCGLMNKHMHRKFRGSKKLHRLRIKMKKCRYVLEALGEPIEALKPLQDLLGEAHDLQMLRKLVGENKKLKSKENLLNQKAVRLVGPAMKFVVGQLSQNS